MYTSTCVLIIATKTWLGHGWLSISHILNLLGFSEKKKEKKKKKQGTSANCYAGEMHNQLSICILFKYM